CGCKAPATKRLPRVTTSMFPAVPAWSPSPLVDLETERGFVREHPVWGHGFFYTTCTFQPLLSSLISSVPVPTATCAVCSICAFNWVNTGGRVMMGDMSALRCLAVRPAGVMTTYEGLRSEEH